MNIEQTKEYQQLCDCYNVKKTKTKVCKLDNLYFQQDKGDSDSYNEFMNKNCHYNRSCNIECEYFIEKEELPKFTPQKQLELIKLILQSRFDLNKNPFIEYQLNGKWKYLSENKSFEQALCELVWNLSPILDHAKVKEILEG